MKTTKRITLLATFIFAQLFFIQCSKENGNANGNQATITVETPDSIPVCNVKIAYVDYDSLLIKFHYAEELRMEIVKKEMSINRSIEEERKILQDEAKEFERKVQNNLYLSQETMQEDYNKIMQKDQELLQRSQQLIGELEKEAMETRAKIDDCISAYIQEYNSICKFDLILTRIGGNMLYANQALNITNDVVEGLNAKHGTKK